MGKWIVSLSLFIALDLFLFKAVAVEDNLYFSGTLVNEPCVLAGEDERVELDFKNIINKDLYLNGRTPGRLINLHLKNCHLDVGISMVSITFSGPESIDPPGMLVVQDSHVQGLLVGLETSRGEPLLMNKKYGMGGIVSGDNLISFNAYLQGESSALADKSIGLGAFSASLNFLINYE